jgi:hypothetical protein
MPRIGRRRPGPGTLPAPFILFRRLAALPLLPFVFLDLPAYPAVALLAHLGLIEPTTPTSST